MSKSVRLKDYLATELEAMAKRENRSLANLVEHLLLQAIAMTKVEPVPGRSVKIPLPAPLADADAESRDVRSRTIARPPDPDPRLMSQVTRTRDSHPVHPDGEIK